jgi:hypothetical protein
MAATQNRPEGAEDEDAALDSDVSGAPDEDGPHDVPDDRVIEKTLPSRPGGSGGPSRGGD